MKDLKITKLEKILTKIFDLPELDPRITKSIFQIKEYYIAKEELMSFVQIKSIISDIICKTVGFLNNTIPDLLLNQLANEGADKLLGNISKSSICNTCIESCKATHGRTSCELYKNKNKEKNERT